MPVAVADRGPWRQIAERLRWTKDAPPRTDHESTRPRNQSTGEFLDAENPTLVTFELHDAIDVAALLANGAIEALVPPKVEAAKVDHPKAAAPQPERPHEPADRGW